MTPMSALAATHRNSLRTRTLGRQSAIPLTTIAAVLISVLAFALPAIGAETPSQLKAFEPYVGKTWKALVNPERKLYDISKWERALANQAVRILHSVGDGAYGGETLIVWDAKQESLVYYYFTTAGFYTQGTAKFDTDGNLETRELVTGNAQGITEVRSIQELLADGRMKVTTKMLRGDTWQEPTVVVYAEAPDAEVILP